MKPRTSWSLFFLILVLGAALRLVRLGEVPPGFFRDEADKGYAAYSLLETGKDLEGRVWPLQIRSLRVYTTPLYQWVTIPFIAVGGLREAPVRLPAAIVGTLTLCAVFLLGRRILGDPAALVAVFLLTVSPWHLPLSRWANQGIFVPLFLSLAVWAYLADRNPLPSSLSRREKEGGEGGERESGWGSTLGLVAGPEIAWGALSGVMFFGALFAYAPGQVFVPLFLLAITLLSLRRAGWHRDGLRTEVWIPFLLLALPYAVHLFSHWGEGGKRFGVISIFASGLSVTELVGQFAQNYLKHLGPGFLFLFGDPNPRHSVPGWGLAYHLEICTVLLGVIRAFMRRSWPDQVLLVWLFAAFVPPALTQEGLPHALRSVAAAPVLPLLSASGLLFLWELTTELRGQSRWGSLPVAAIPLVLLIQSLAFVKGYFTTYPLVSYPYWEYGYREAVEEIEKHYRFWDPIFVRPISDYAEAQFLFYQRVDPEGYQRALVEYGPGARDLPGDLAGITLLPPSGDRLEPPPVDRGLALLYPWEPPRGTLLATIRGPDSQPIWNLYRLGDPGQNPSRTLPLIRY